MATIEQQLTQLESDRQDLVDNLETKGISGLTGDETFTELVPEVLNIPVGESPFTTYNQTSVYTPPGSWIGKYIKNIDSLDLGTSTQGFSFFYGCSNLEYVGNLLNTSQITTTQDMFRNCYKLSNAPLFDTSNVTNMGLMFYDCQALTTVPLYNTSKVTNTNVMFYNCQALTTVPLFDLSSVTNMQNMFQKCRNLNNDSLNNILAMCINATSYSGTKTLKQLGLTSTQATTCTTLSNYQDFLDAGWTTGY